MEFKITLFQSEELGINNGALIEPEIGDIMVVEEKYELNLWPKISSKIESAISQIVDKSIYQNIDIEK